MRRFIKGLSLLAVLAGSAFLTLPAWAGSNPGQGIIATSHDFTKPSGSAYYAGASAGKASLCVYCHIQHKFPTVIDKTVKTRLLWNHKLSAQTFSWGDVTQTVGGTPLPPDLNTSLGSSKLCLGCHDGTVSVGDLYRGTYTDVWTGSHVDTNGFMISGARIGNLSGEMAGNHPVGIPYPYNNTASTYNGIATGSGVNLTDFVASPVNVKLFTDVGGDYVQGPTVGATGIECASCHDPHNKHTLDFHFLRDYYQVSTGSPSKICLDCHNKGN
jgi:hypothetical protein